MQGTLFGTLSVGYNKIQNYDLTSSMEKTVSLTTFQTFFKTFHKPPNNESRVMSLWNLWNFLLVILLNLWIFAFLIYTTISSNHFRRVLNSFRCFLLTVKSFMLEFFLTSSPKMLNKIVQLQKLVKFVSEVPWSSFK